MRSSTDRELLVVVNERDEIIGAEERAAVHERHLLHRAIHVLVFTHDGRVVIQRRSARKDTYPKHWECVGGHVGVGESYEAAAIREVREELGIVPSSMEFMGKVDATAATDWEFIEVFKAVVSPPFRPAPDEVAEIAMMLPAELAKEAAAGARLFSPVFLNTLSQVPLL